MKRVLRDPEKSEVFDLYSAIGLKQDFKLNDKSSERSFIDCIKKSIEINKTPINLHGRRVESMFAFIAAALGKCILIKKEDSGEVFIESKKVIIPDYRIITKEKQQFLVEVKNCHNEKASGKLKFNTNYIEALNSYATIMNLETKIAIYWSSWNLWVLLSIDALNNEGSYFWTNLIDSLEKNQMVLLGDYQVGTKPPLMLRILSNPNKNRLVGDDGETSFTIGNIELFCDGKLITQKEEANIAFYLMLYGEWGTTEPKVNLKDNELISIEYLSEPNKEETEQNFTMIGVLSSMISQQYNVLTAPYGEIERFTPNIEPELLGMKIEDDYKGNQLPLWRFMVSPKKENF